MKKTLPFLASALLFCFVLSCKKKEKDDVVTPSSAKDILTFTVSGQSGNASIDVNNHTVSCQVFSNVNLTSLTPVITISDKASITPGGAQDFSGGAVTYTVTAEDGTGQAWAVTIIKVNNIMLSGSQQGQPFGATVINDMTLASDGQNVTLLAAVNSTGKVFAIDIADNNPADAAGNTITTLANFKQQIATIIGTTVGNVTINNMEVNPISKALYVLATSGGVGRIFIVTGGNTVSQLNLTNVKYCSMTYNTNFNTLQDMTYGDNNLYLTMGANFSLDGEIVSVPSPFVHNSSGTSRLTTHFKTNWGSSYYTDAPLEKITYGVVDGVKRLMGVTLCAPGFSIKTSDVAGTGLLQVKEWYNLNGMAPIKVVSITQGTTTYLLDLHTLGKIVRVGEKYLDESQTSFNASAPMLRDGSGNVSSGLNASECYIYNGTWIMMAKESDTNLIVLDSSGGLSTLAL